MQGVNVTHATIHPFPRILPIATPRQAAADGKMTRCFLMLGKTVHVASTTGVKVRRHQHSYIALSLVSSIFSLPVCPVVSPSLTHTHACLACLLLRVVPEMLS